MGYPLPEPADTEVPTRLSDQQGGLLSDTAAPEPPEPAEPPDGGDEDPAAVVPVDDDAERAWRAVEKAKEDDEVVRGKVVEIVKGGLILDIGVRGFLPASLVELRRIRDLRAYLGRELEAKIIDLDRNRNNVVLSRRAWLEQTQSEGRAGFLDKLQPGQIRRGVVSSVVNFGAFVDLGGVDGLVHISELSWLPVRHPSEVVAVGQEVEVEVVTVDRDRDRVSLSMKATQEDPWHVFARVHTIGQIMAGEVTRLAPFGAFVRVGDGIEGLVHISELADRHIEQPEQVVRAGQGVLVRIIDIDLERRRISLSVKQADEAYLEEEEYFDPALYGMTAAYDAEGNYIYPEGFDAETGEWREGAEAQRDAWEAEYARAHELWQAHGRQVRASRGQAEPVVEQPRQEPATAAQSVDDALQALREKLAGGRD